MNKTTHELFIEELNKIPKDTEMWITESFNIANKIALLMDANGLTKSDMAQIFNISEDTVAWWIGGTYNFDLKTIAKISTYFNISLISSE